LILILNDDYSFYNCDDGVCSRVHNHVNDTNETTTYNFVLDVDAYYDDDDNNVLHLMTFIYI
jgi:hypothetical protein